MTYFITPKPERLIQRVLHIATNPGDLVLDSFLGSGTTAAVAHKMGRRWIGIEMGDHAVTHCQPRLAKVIAGEQGGISAAVGWQGGGAFRFFRLGEAVFDENGQIRGDIDFPALAAHVWFSECGVPWSAQARVREGVGAPCWASMPGAGHCPAVQRHPQGSLRCRGQCAHTGHARGDPARPAARFFRAAAGLWRTLPAVASHPRTRRDHLPTDPYDVKARA
jgi:hypothetical protein